MDPDVLVSPRRLVSALEGAAVVAAVALVPLALVTALRAHLEQPMGLVARVLVAAGALAWCAVIVHLSRLVVLELRGKALASAHGPLAWAAVRIAALAIALAPFLATSAGASTAAPSTVRSPAAVAIAPSPRAERMYTVRTGDTLWSIASQQLGDPERWTEIAALNLGRAMPGGRTFDDPSLILPDGSCACLEGCRRTRRWRPPQLTATWRCRLP